MNIWKFNRKKLNEIPFPEDSYFRKAFDFATDWMGGKEDFLLHTSGSTGRPQPIRLKRKQMVASALATGAALHLPAGTRALVCLNVDYIAGVMMLVRGLVLDWELTVMEPTGNPLLHLPDEVEFDFTALVPMQLQACLQHPSTQKEIDRLGKVLLGGAPVSLALEQELQSLSIPVYLSYGMTETVSHIALRALNGALRSEEYQVLEGVKIGVDLRNCLYISGAVTDDQRVQTNDLVELTSSRSFRWLGRYDSIINSGGLKIQLDKIDRKIGEVTSNYSIIPPIFAWYEPDERLGQKLILFVEGPPSILNAEGLLDALRAKVKSYEIPKAVYFVNEFKKTPTGKVNKIATATTFFSTPT